MKLNDERANKFAIADGWAGTEYLGEWNGYSCYRPKASPKYESGYMAPIIILVKDGVARFADQDEALDCPY